MRPLIEEMVTKRRRFQSDVECLASRTKRHKRQFEPAQEPHHLQSATARWRSVHLANRYTLLLRDSCPPSTLPILSGPTIASYNRQTPSLVVSGRTLSTTCAFSYLLTIAAQPPSENLVDLCHVPSLYIPSCTAASDHKPPTTRRGPFGLC